MAELAPFTALPPVRVGEDALAQLRRSVAALEKARQAALTAIGVAFTVIGCVHLAYVAERARSPPPIPLSLVFRGGCWPIPLKHPPTGGIKVDQLLVSPDRLAQLEELLLLFHRFLTEPTPPPRRRDWLLEHCTAQERR